MRLGSSSLREVPRVPIVLIGHVTKDGSLAGPKSLEHLVDTVLTLEGDRTSLRRMLRATKNRFGPVDELALYDMTGEGMRRSPTPPRPCWPSGAGVFPEAR